MAARKVYFVAPHEIEVREEPVPDPGPGEVRVETITSAVSPGTERLVYRGEFSEGLAADETIDALSGSLSFPIPYGYAAVGTVVETGEDVDQGWNGDTVFAFHPHASEFVVSVEDVVEIPEGVEPRRAVLLPHVETAVNFLLDGAPRIGERVAVFGQGPVGLLTTSLLEECPLDSLVTFDLHEHRRSLSTEFGADDSFDPTKRDPSRATRDVLEDDGADGVDLVYELSGNPAALDAAVDVAGYDGRVVLGSWYGTKPAELTLDGRFHRSRIDVVTSQVSTIAPELCGRWDTDRRLGEASRRLDDVPVDRLVADEFPVERAPLAYRLLDEEPPDVLEILFTY